MKSKTSFINKGILQNDIKRFIWIGLVYLLGLLLTVPVKILMLFSQEKAFTFNYDILNNPYIRIFNFNSEYHLLLTLLVPVITGLLLFRYLQSGKAADMIHTLPIKRETLYNTHLLAGSILLLVPIIITALVSWVIINGLGIAYVHTGDILIWTGISLLMNLLLFMCSAAVGMFTGMSSMQGVLTYILLFLPAGLTVLLLHNMKLYLYGFAYIYSNIRAYILSPLSRIVELSYEPITTVEVLIYLLITLAFYLIGRYLYRHRQLEMAGNAIAFNLLSPVFKYGLTFCSMLLFGSYFSAAQYGIGWTYFGYLTGSLLGYFLAEILIKKSFYVFKFAIAKGYVVFALIVVLLIGGLNYDLTGFEKRLPDLADVEEVYFDHSFYNLNRPVNSGEQAADVINEDYFQQTSKMYNEKDNIERIYRLHQELIANKKLEKNRLYNYNTNERNICLAYRLKSDRMFYREYRINIEDYAASLKPIYESLEYKNQHYIILGVKPENVDLIEINADNVNKSVKITDPVLIKQAVGALKTDAVNHTYEQMTSNKPVWASVRMLLDNENRINISWDKSDEEFGEWLKSIGEYDNARILPSDIEYAVVFIQDDNDQKAYGRNSALNIEEYLAVLGLKQDYLRITDSEQLETCLENYTHDHIEKDYSIIFVLKNGDSITGGISLKTAPDFIKSHFARN